LAKVFFQFIGPYLISENFHDSVKSGKRIAGAEFCNPIDSIYGHVTWLVDRADYIFLPIALQSGIKPKIPKAIIAIIRNTLHHWSIPWVTSVSLQSCLLPGLILAKDPVRLSDSLQHLFNLSWDPAHLLLK